VGDQTNLPSELKENKGRRKSIYQLLPLLLGILGIVFQLTSGKGKENTDSGLPVCSLCLQVLPLWVYRIRHLISHVSETMLMQVLAMSFSIWIGLGVLFLRSN
jgi:hypothetical protein